MQSNECVSNNDTKKSLSRRKKVNRHQFYLAVYLRFESELYCHSQANNIINESVIYMTRHNIYANFV